MPRQIAASINQTEIDRFSELSAEWWQEKGAFAPLHRLNPLRCAYVEKQIGKSVSKIKILDVGCGGGLFAEEMAKRGAIVTGIDASPEAIAVAQAHAKKNKLSIAYETTSVESMAQKKTRFNLITAFEVIEHVQDRASFLNGISKLLAPDGHVILASVNRTKKSFFLSIVMAEYILRWLPVGTHEWNDFVTPFELTKALQKANLETTDITGLVYNPLKNTYALAPHRCAANYLLTAQSSRGATAIL